VRWLINRPTPAQTPAAATSGPCPELHAVFAEHEITSTDDGGWVDRDRIALGNTASALRMLLRAQFDAGSQEGVEGARLLVEDLTTQLNSAISGQQEHLERISDLERTCERLHEDLGAAHTLIESNDALTSAIETVERLRGALIEQAREIEDLKAAASSPSS
jgi:hypothetical protein